MTTVSWARAQRARGSRTPGPKLPTRCASWCSPGLYQTFTLGGRQSVVPSCTHSSWGVAARSVSNLVSIGGFRSQPVADASGVPVLRDQGLDRPAEHGKTDPCPRPTAPGNRRVLPSMRLCEPGNALVADEDFRDHGRVLGSRPLGQDGAQSETLRNPDKIVGERGCQRPDAPMIGHDSRRSCSFRP